MKTTYLVIFAAALSGPKTAVATSGCCSLDYKNCIDWCGSTKDSCLNCNHHDGVGWLQNGPPTNTCLSRWTGCGSKCCDGLVCKEDANNYLMCLPGNPIGTKSPTDSPTERTTASPTESPTESSTEAPADSPSEAPIDAPMEAPTDSLSEAPTVAPTVSLTNLPTLFPTFYPTNFPSSEPTSTTACANDPNFMYKDDPTKDCYWVGKDTESRCTKKWNGKLLHQYCPLICESKFLFKYMINRNCEWVGLHPGKRCSKKWDGVELRTYCPSVCNSCPTTTMSANDDGTEPTSATACANDPTFMFKDDPTKDCYWVGKEAENRCTRKWNGKQLHEYCPVVCETCPDVSNIPCADDPTFLFKNESDKDCEWVGLNPEKRCSKMWMGSELRTHCPSACDSCQTMTNSDNDYNDNNNDDSTIPPPTTDGSSRQLRGRK